MISTAQASAQFCSNYRSAPEGDKAIAGQKAQPTRQETSEGKKGKTPKGPARGSQVHFHILITSINRCSLFIPVPMIGAGTQPSLNCFTNTCAQLKWHSTMSPCLCMMCKAYCEQLSNFQCGALGTSTQTRVFLVQRNWQGGLCRSGRMLSYGRLAPLARVFL